MRYVASVASKPLICRTIDVRNENKTKKKSTELGLEESVTLF